MSEHTEHSSLVDERRKAQRVEAQLKMQVKLWRPDGSEASAALETINISTSGVYFRSDHFIQPMTKLAMGLELSVPATNTAEGTEMAIVECEGLVVRTGPEFETPDCDDYEVAVFFTSISPESVTILERHIGMLIGTD